MNDDFEPRVQRWLRERGEVEPATVKAVAGHVAVLPPHRTGPRRAWLMAAAAIVLVAVAGLGIVVVPRSSGGPGPTPPDPAAFVGDPRLALCGAGLRDLLAVFELARLSDYPAHLPAAYPLIGLQGDPSSPALVVIFAGPAGKGRLPVRDPQPAGSPSTNHHDLCIVVGADSASWATVRVIDVDVDGLRATLDATPPSSSPTSVGASPTAAAEPTAVPAPAWTADLAGQLECDGATPGIGGEIGEFSAAEPALSPDAALQALLDRGEYASFPAGGFEPAEVEGHWARHDYLVDGRRKALAVTSDRAEGWPDGSGWFVVGIRSCDASEFDPSDGLTYDQALWLDANGKLARSDTIASIPGPGHCGWESATFLRFEGVQYLRDPKGVFEVDRTVLPFDPDVPLPVDAVDSGYHTPDWHLFTVPAGDAVYIRTTHGTFERWGRAREEVGCM